MFGNEDGLGMVQVSVLLGFIAVAFIIALFVMGCGGANVGAYIL